MNMLDYALPPLSLEEEEECLRNLESDSLEEQDEARNKLLLSNLKLIKQWALELKSQAIPLDDLIAEGILGFLHAITKYEAGHGTRLPSYAMWWVKQRMRTALAKQSGVVTVPQHAIKTKATIFQAARDYEKEHNKVPDIEELAKYMGKSVDYVKNNLNSLCANVSDLDTEDEDKPSLTDRITAIGDVKPVFEYLRDEEEVKAYTKAWKYLTKREKIILTLRYGLDGQTPVSLEQLGQELGRCAESCRQLQDKATKRLKKLVKGNMK